LWISDREAMELSDEQRKALVGWMTVISGGKDVAKKVNIRKGASGSLPPHLKSMVKTEMNQAFVNIILNDQDLFYSEDHWKELIKLLPAGTSRSTLEESWSNNSFWDSSEKWTKLTNMVGAMKSPEKQDWKAAVEDIIIQYTYPRLDAEVSKHRNHLLKAPFCVHPKTGRVCVPVDPATIDEFDPEAVPTVFQLLSELNEVAATGSQEHHDDWEKTKLKAYVDMLDKHVLGLMEEVRRTKRERGSLTW